VNRLGRFRESEILRHIFERCLATGLVKGEGFAVDASVMEANASRYHGKAPDELDWTDRQRQKRAVAEYLGGLEAEARVLATFWLGAAAMTLIFSFLGFLASRLPRRSPLAMLVSGFSK